VQRPPLEPEEMFNRRGVSFRVARKYAESIIKAIAEAKQQDISFLETPLRSNWKPPSRAARSRLEILKRWRNKKAKDLGLPIGVVFPACLLENLAIAPPADLEAFAILPGMRQWRVREFGTELIGLLQTQESHIALQEGP